MNRSLSDTSSTVLKNFFLCPSVTRSKNSNISVNPVGDFPGGGFPVEFPHFAVLRAVFHQRFVVTRSNDPAPVHQGYLICIDDAFQAVGHDDLGSSFFQILKGSDNFKLVLRIEGGTDFVKQQNRCVFKNGSGYIYPLLILP